MHSYKLENLFDSRTQKKKKNPREQTLNKLCLNNYTRKKWFLAHLQAHDKVTSSYFWIGLLDWQMRVKTINHRYSIPGFIKISSSISTNVDILLVSREKLCGTIIESDGFILLNVYI